MQRRVVVAMSGGVDSSVAAALLVEQGYQVIGVMLRLWAERQNRCCAPEAVDDARQVAAQLAIPFYLLNYETEFKAAVVDYFVEEYGRGRTPNPCIACNRHIRFGRLLQQVEALDAEFLATGHYARVDREGGQYRLRTGMDGAKDQSYVLYMLGQEELRRVRFPVGSYTKAQVRGLARSWGLRVADKDESMEICFVADDDYRRFLGEQAPGMIRPGPILDTSGREIGRHPGLAFYTVGQRRGLGVPAPQPYYVIGLDTARNALVVGHTAELGRSSLTATDVHYVGGTPPDGPARVQVKIRHKATPAAATWIPVDGQLATVDLDAPLRDITPGQAVVAYQGDCILGGGTIDVSRSEAGHLGR